MKVIFKNFENPGQPLKIQFSKCWCFNSVFTKLESLHDQSLNGIFEVYLASYSFQNFLYF